MLLITDNVMQACTHTESHAAAQAAMLVGTLTHLSSYLQTGCPHSLHRVRLLLTRLDGKPGFNPLVSTSVEALEEFEELVSAICVSHRIA